MVCIAYYWVAHRCVWQIYSVLLDPIAKSRYHIKKRIAWWRFILMCYTKTGVVIPVNTVTSKSIFLMFKRLVVLPYFQVVVRWKPRIRIASIDNIKLTTLVERLRTKWALAASLRWALLWIAPLNNYYILLVTIGISVASSSNLVVDSNASNWKVGSFCRSSDKLTQFLCGNPWSTASLYLPSTRSY